jgi:ParB-like chromosome segregation protein Spo0J
MTVHAMAKHIEHWPLDKLIPYTRNPRTHSDAQVAQIAASITEFGFNNPILVDTNSGIIAGHGRLLAARKLQLLEVPVIVLDHLSETQKRAYVLADNKLALNADWDEELLALELQELKEFDFDLSLTGFDSKEIDDLMLGADDDEKANTAPPLPDNPVSRVGDL